MWLFSRIQNKCSVMPFTDFGNILLLWNLLLRRVTRADVASVLFAAILNPKLSRNLRFDLSSDPDKPAGDFLSLFDDARDWSGSWHQWKEWSSWIESSAGRSYTWDKVMNESYLHNRYSIFDRPTALTDLWDFKSRAWASARSEPTIAISAKSTHQNSNSSIHFSGPSYSSPTCNDVTMLSAQVTYVYFVYNSKCPHSLP
jgi:hypothetical protein